MNKMRRFIVCAIVSMGGLWIPAHAQAQSAFDGTWHINMAQSKLSPKPYVFYLSQGWYHCVSCNPSMDVQADGQDHPVAGQSYDTASVKEVDPNTITVVGKKAGKVLFEQTSTVSADGKTLTLKATANPINSDKPVTSEVGAKRIGIAPSGVHATSGQWQVEKVNVSDNGLDFTLKMNGDELTMSQTTGESYTAKLDGSDSPYKGSAEYDTVSLKKIDAHTIEETDKRGGKAVDVSKMSVSGKKMTIVDTYIPNDRTSTFIATKK